MSQSVAPYVLYEDGEAASEFLCRAFGFREVDRATGAAGGMHLELETELGGTIYAGQPPEGYRNSGPSPLHAEGTFAKGAKRKSDGPHGGPSTRVS